MINKELGNKSFWQVAVTLTKEISRDVEEFMIKSGALGFHELLYEEGITENLQNEYTIHYYYFPSDFPVSAFVPMVLEIFNSGDCKYEIKQVHYEDFLKSMELTFTPFMVTKNYCIVPPWKLDEPVEGTKLIINPAFAFGTGRHATSQLVIDVMEHLDFKGKNVLDMGSGSGILAIASLLMGASHVVGVDVESLSVESGIENFIFNKNYHKLTSRADFFEGDFSWVHSNKDFNYSIFLSNILPDVFYKNENDFLVCLQKAEFWILSGIVKEKESDFLKWLTDLTHEKIINKKEKDDWYVFYNF
ncbi:MAG: 50S ribosomal protein L11 methyltransferase [Spirochaetia bacterium]|nr:50S ribosomal protein L11 methyltransferase [Spirochaetia bacterium]